MAVTVKLATNWPARQQLTLTLPLPVVKNPQRHEDCPMLDEAVEFALGGQAPLGVQRGYYDYTQHDFGEPTRACYDHATVVFDVPLAGGRLPLTATSPDGESSLMVDIPPAFQPTVVDPQPSYPRAAILTLQVPPEFLASIGMSALPFDVNGAFTGGTALSFDVAFYKHDGGDYDHGGYLQSSDVSCDGTTISIPIPTSADYQIDDIYLTYWLNRERVLDVDACAGLASCSGVIGMPGIFAPVTINVGP
jgi:hypothetical protein